VLVCVCVARTLASESFQPVSSFASCVCLVCCHPEGVRDRIMDEFKQPGLFYHLTEMVCRTPRSWSSDEDCAKNGCMPPCMRGCPQQYKESYPDLSVEMCTEACTDECTQQCDQTCKNQKWLSHPIHADANRADCDMLDDGVCVRRLPVDFTSHLYLNENFEGGDFFFVDGEDGGDRPEQAGDDVGVRTVVQPTCGRMLAYSSGLENQHGVTGLHTGERCLITLWLTPDGRKAEQLPLPDGSPFLIGRKQGHGRDIHPASLPENADASKE